MALSPKELVYFSAGISGRNPRLEGCLPKPVLVGSRGRVPFSGVLVVFASAVGRRVLVRLADALGPIDLFDVRRDHRRDEGLPILPLEDPVADRGPREPLPIEQGRREHLQAVLPEQTNDEVGVRVDHVEARDEGRDMADPHAVHVGVGDWDDVVVVDPFRVEGPLDHLVPLPGREGIFARVAVLGRADSDDDLLVRFQDPPHHREVSTGTIWIFPWYLSSRRTSFMFDRGMTTFSIPSSAAASIFAVTPPTGRTCPRTLREPVIATAWFTGTSSRALMTAVATEIEALSPSVPSREPTNWTWMSWFEMSSPVYFLISAATFSTASFAISPSRPVAMMRPPCFACAGVTSAAIGKTMPLNSAIELSPTRTARPFTMPTIDPSVMKVWYSLPRSIMRSATCCSRERAMRFAFRTCFAVTRGVPSSWAMSPATRINPPNSRRRRVSCPRRPALRWASRRISRTAVRSKCGIFRSFETSWATNRTSLRRLSSVSSIVAFM